MPVIVVHEPPPPTPPVLVPSLVETVILWLYRQKAEGYTRAVLAQYMPDLEERLNDVKICYSGKHAFISQEYTTVPVGISGVTKHVFRCNNCVLAAAAAHRRG